MGRLFTLSLILLVGCLRLPPDLTYQIWVVPDPEVLDQEAYYFDTEDSTTVFQREGFRLKLRFLSDELLNQEYTRHTFREPSLNPFTYGTDRDLDLGYSPPRFTVFQMTVVNPNYPKVMIDPAKMVLRTDRGDRYEYWDVRQRDAANSFEVYYRERRGQGGNEDHYYQQRLGLVREALYQRNTFVFQGESYAGKVVFAPLHAEVREVVVEVREIVLRVDAFDRPKETVDAVFRFAVDQKIIRREE